MRPFPKPLELSRIRVFPLAERRSMARIEDILVDPDTCPPDCSAEQSQMIRGAAEALRAARSQGAGSLFIYGAHLVKNGGSALLERLMSAGWITHLATNGAGSIHDWEFAYQNWSTESVEQNVATGTFGTWAETGRNIQLALLCGALRSEGYGISLGRFILEDGTVLPSVEFLEGELQREPGHPLSPARAELLCAMRAHGIEPGRHEVRHAWKHTSVFANAVRLGVPITVHPGIGYDIISNHPMFNGGAVGRAAGLDFGLFGAAVESLDHGVVFSVGSAIMGPQVFEKSLSCVNNLRLQAGRPVVRGLVLFVVDLQDGGNWDWSAGEPPKENPAYYLRFCKSYSRMGGTMHYLQCDNVLFLHHLWKSLQSPTL